MPLPKSVRLFFLFFALLPLAAPAAALELTPFAVSNQNPLVAVYGLPAAASSRVLAPGRTTAELRADIVSSYSKSDSGQEEILLDGEIYRYTLALKHGIGDRLEVGVEVPYVLHREGFLDGFINDFHRAFGLPDGGRSDAAKDQLSYAYEKDGVTLLDRNEEEEGIGDLRLTAAWQLLQEETGAPRALALRASLELPTGDEDRLTGSGSTDFALWLSGSRSFRGTVALYGAAGGLLMSDGDVLADQQRNAVAFGTFGIGWRALSRLALKVQADAHSAFYRDSNLRELGESVQVTLGGSVGLSDTLQLDIALVEDLVADSAPDAVFHFALRKVF